MIDDIVGKPEDFHIINENKNANVHEEKPQNPTDNTTKTMNKMNDDHIEDSKIHKVE